MNTPSKTNEPRYCLYEIHDSHHAGDIRNVEVKTLVKEFDSLTEAYAKRDELQARALATGATLRKRRYVVRLR